MLITSLLSLALLSPALQQSPTCDFEPAHIGDVPEGFIALEVITWSPNGKRVAYVAHKDGETFPIIDNEPFRSFLFLEKPSFSSDSEHVVFRAGERINPKKERWWPFVDGKLGKKHDWIGKPHFRPESDQLVYWTQPGAKIQNGGAYNQGKQVLVWGKKKGKKWDAAASLAKIFFSDDGKVGLTTAQKGGKWQVISTTSKKEKVLGDGGEFFGDMALSPNGKRYAVRTDSYDTSELSKPRKPGAPFKMPKALHTLHLVDKPIGEQFESVGGPAFSRDGKTLGFKYIADDKFGVADEHGLESPAEFTLVSQLQPLSKQKGLVFAACIDGEVQEALKWFPGAERMITGAKHHVVQVDKEGVETFRSAAFDLITQVVLAPPETTFAFTAKTKQSWQVIWGEQKSPEFDYIGDLHFSEDGKQLAFGTRTEDSLDWYVMTLDEN